MRHLKNAHPEYADRVQVVLLNIDPLEDAERIRSYRDREGLPWPMTAAYPEVVKSYNVTRQAAFVTVDSNGIVASNVKYGREDTDDWRGVFEFLLGS